MVATVLLFVRSLGVIIITKETGPERSLSRLYGAKLGSLLGWFALESGPGGLEAIGTFRG